VGMGILIKLGPFSQKNEVKFNFIKCNSEHYGIRTICHVTGASPPANYACVKRSGQLISADMLHFNRRAQTLFNDSRRSLGSRKLTKKFREEGFQVGR